MNYGFSANNSLERPSEKIENDGFFPELSISEFSDGYGLPANMKNEVIEIALLSAMGRINSALEEFRTLKLMGEGFVKLEQVTASQLGGVSEKVIQYKQAVYGSAKAELLRSDISMDRKPNAENKANNAEEMITHYERLSTRAIANVQGKRMIGIHTI